MMSKALAVFILTAWFIVVPVSVQSQTIDDYLAGAQREMDLWNHEEAIGFYDQALELDRTRPRVFFMRGTAKRETGDTEGALQDFDQALELNPGEPEYYYERGMLRYYVQDYQGAVYDFDDFLELIPSTEIILKLRGESKYQLEDYTGAVADYSEALEQGPDNPELYYLRAYARTEQEDWAGAIQDFTVVMDMPPLDGQFFDKRDTALLRRANVKLRSVDYEGAHADCDLAIERDGLDLEAHFIRGKARLAMERFREAVEDFDIVIERYPMPEAYHDRGTAKQGLGDDGGAESDFEQALELGE